MHDIKMIVTDLDRTLLKNDKKICLMPNALDVSLESKKFLRIQEGIKHFVMEM